VVSQQSGAIGDAAALARDPARLRDAFCDREPLARADPAAIRIVRAPGRINLIGEHTDYNDGLVLPVAIDLAISIAFVPTATRRADLSLATTGERAIVDLDAPARARSAVRHWSDYVAGMARALANAGGRAGGFVGLLASVLPVGAGLSSSAAFDIAIGWALGSGHPGLGDPMAFARAAQLAENEYVGVPCGLMDPFAVVFGVPGSAVFLDCRSLEHRSVALPAETAIVVTESGETRGLRTSGYATRRAECAAAVAVLARLDPGIRSLRDVTVELLEDARAELGETGYRRARHVLTENRRVTSTVAALEAGEPTEAGRLLLEGHASLRDDFEVSTPALDQLVAIAGTVPGVHGARMTGGGFGGSMVSLVREDAVDRLVATLRERYRSPSGEPPVVRRVIPSAGAALVAIPA